MTDARGLIQHFGMRPHPEGGWYAETFRDAEAGRRPQSTAILFLLEADQVSRWHRVLDAAEVWHFHAGAAMDLAIAPPDGSARLLRLGIDVPASETPQAVVPAGWWQAARSSGAWTLVGCTVSPGFVFESFELAEAGWEPPGAPFSA